MKPRVVVVIPNWNGADLISECLASLEAQTYKADILVVDNGSVDESLTIIKEKHPAVKAIELPENIGFAGGVNTGIRYALDRVYDAVALFNNDAIADKNWLKNLVETLQSNDGIGIVSCKQLRSDGEYIDSTGDSYSIWGMPFPRGRNHKDEGQYDSQEEIFSAPAAATLYRSEMLRQIGLFDDRFFAYLEDVDISFRARLAGWKIMYQPAATIRHGVSVTSNRLGSFTRYHFTKNFFLLYAKNMPGYLYWKYLPLFILQALRLGASSTLRGGFVPFMKGAFKALLLTPHIIRERRKIQKNRKVSISEIDRLLYHARPPKIPPL